MSHSSLSDGTRSIQYDEDAIADRKRRESAHRSAHTSTQMQHDRMVADIRHNIPHQLGDTGKRIAQSIEQFRIDIALACPLEDETRLKALLLGLETAMSHDMIKFHGYFTSDPSQEILDKIIPFTDKIEHRAEAIDIHRSYIRTADMDVFTKEDLLRTQSIATAIDGIASALTIALMAATKMNVIPEEQIAEFANAFEHLLGRTKDAIQKIIQSIEIK